MDVEERAKLMGWVPKEDFKGDPERWTSAEDFVERADNIMPIMKAQNAKYEEKLKSTTEVLKSTQAEIAELKDTMKKMAKVNETVSQREYDRALETIRKEQQDAIESSDGAKWSKLEQDKDKLLKNPPERVEFKDDGNATTNNPVFDSWVEQNQWYSTDPSLRDYADYIGGMIQAQEPYLKGEAFFDAVKERVKATFPDKFENKNRKKPANVDSGSGPSDSDSKGGKKTYRDLPKEAREACDRFVADEIMTKEEYVKEYFSDE